MTHKNQALVIPSTFLGLVLLVFCFNQAFAITTINTGSLTVYNQTDNGGSLKIGIILSQECITALKNLAKTSCPSYQNLQHFDNTNPNYYGKFDLDKSGFYGRHHVKIPNYYNIANPTGKYIVAIDPTVQFIGGAQIIRIVPDSFTFINPNESVGENHTRNEYVDRGVRQCIEATISYSEFLVNDTISYLESGCKTTSYKDHIVKPTGNKAFTLDNPYSTLHQMSYLRSVMHGHTYNYNGTGSGYGPEDCIHKQCSFIDPYHKSGY